MLKELFLNLIRKYSDNENYNSECWNEIESKYSSKSRHYHNLDHLKNMLSELDIVKSQVKKLDALLFAIFYHDIIYKSTRSDNEHRSALTFEKRISKTSFSHLNECMEQIEMTKEHKLSSDQDTNILLDLDLSILGKSPKEYKEYCIQIRNEYSIYPNFIYRKGRTKALKSILDSNSIFKTDFFKQQYENQAQENLKLELSQLK